MREMKRTRRLVQDDDPGVLRERPRERHERSLADAEVEALVFDDGVKGEARGRAAGREGSGIRAFVDKPGPLEGVPQSRVVVYAEWVKIRSECAWKGWLLASQPGLSRERRMF